MRAKAWSANGRSVRSARLLVLGAALLWGTTGTAQALGPGGATPLAVGTVRLVLGGAVLIVIAVARRPGEPSATHDGMPVPGRAAALRLDRSEVLPALGTAAAIAAYQLTFFAAVARTGVAVGTVIAIGSAPAATGLLDRLLRGDRPERGWGLATLLAVLGSALLLAPVGPTRVDALGLLLALGAGVSYAGYTVGSKRLMDGGRAPSAAMAIGFGGGALLVAPLLTGVDLAWLGTPRGVAVAVWLAVVTMGASYVLFGRGLRWLPSSSVATLSLAEPLTAAALGVLLLGERPGVLAAVGAAVVLSGLAVLGVPRRMAPRPHERRASPRRHPGTT